jgi:hypothetical protein
LEYGGLAVGKRILKPCEALMTQEKQKHKYIRTKRKGAFVVIGYYDFKDQH